jgi:DNA-binding transcriptional LysR family regulator
VGAAPAVRNRARGHALVSGVHGSGALGYDPPVIKGRKGPPPPSAGDAAHALQLLVAIADLGSFTAAGERLALTPSAVSKAVARTEARLGVQLVKRTTRRVAFTDHGEAYVARGRRVLAEMEALERDAASREGTVRGLLRVSAPAVYGAIKVAPPLAALQREHPALDVHLRCEDRLIDMVVERVDVAVRILEEPPAEFVARQVADDRRRIYASPSYLRRAHLPRAPEDLAGHAAITYSGEPTLLTALRRSRVVFATDSVLAAREAALGGIGIAVLPEYLALDDVSAGRLREVLPGSVPVTRRVYVLYLPSPFLPPPVRVCVDALVRALAAGEAPRRVEQGS